MGSRWRGGGGDHGGQGAAAPDDDGDAELTVDELAARAGVTVRNLRAYAARGLLPPPRMVGRTGYYGREHVARLLLVREMLAEGYSLAMIERTLASAPPIGQLGDAGAAPRTAGAVAAARARGHHRRGAGCPRRRRRRTRRSSTSWWSSGMVERLGRRRVCGCSTRRC